MNLGAGEIILILLVLLLLFGAKRLPELAKGLGKSLKEFKKATKDVQDEIENAGESEHQIKSDNSGEKKEKSSQDQ